MTEIIEILFELYNLDNSIKEIENPEYKKLGFKIDDPSTQLLKTKADLLKKLPRDLAENYERLRKRYTWVFAPAKNGICFGCFQRLPTELMAKVDELHRTENIIYCPNCGKILYLLK